jgi:hypothetical protein
MFWNDGSEITMCRIDASRSIGRFQGDTYGIIDNWPCGAKKSRRIKKKRRSKMKVKRDIKDTNSPDGGPGVKPTPDKVILPGHPTTPKYKPDKTPKKKK